MDAGCEFLGDCASLNEEEPRQVALSLTHPVLS